jgi:hypothetical protein
MSDIHYFPRYSQPENVVTNNTLLFLLRLHQYNRFKFEKFMGSLCDDQDFQLTTSWLQFSQQKGSGKSIVDGFIAQESVKIAVETKLSDSFDPSQLRNHLDIFHGEQHQLLILLSPALGEAQSSQLASIREEAHLRNIQVLHTSFQNIIENAWECLSEHDEEMRALVADYESFCSERRLLPRDKYTLFVPPCGQSYEANEAFHLYYCPASWTRRNAKYLGVYAQRTVRSIGRIAKVVSCTIDLKANSVTVLKGQEKLTSDEQARILGAARNAETHKWNITVGHKFYLCDLFEETDFRKTSPGGIWGHRYFDLEKVLGVKVPSDLKSLAALLRQHPWPKS